MSSPGSVASSSTAGSSSPAVSHSTDSSLFSTNDSDYSTLSKLTRALLSLTGYNIPEDTPVSSLDLLTAESELIQRDESFRCRSLQILPPLPPQHYLQSSHTHLEALPPLLLRDKFD